MASKWILGALIPVTVVSLAGNALLYQRYSASRPLMHMGKEQVTRKEYQDRLDFLYGKQVLNRIAYSKIVRQAALQKGVAPTDAEVQMRLTALQQNNPAGYERLQADPARFQDLREDAWTSAALDNLRIQNVSITNAEAEAFYARNRTLFAQPFKVETSIVVAQNLPDANGAADMLRQGIALSVIARRPRLNVVGAGWQPRWYSLPPTARKQLADSVKTVPPGGVQVIPVGDIFFIVRVDRRHEAAMPSEAAVRNQVEKMAKLAKAPSAKDTLARLYRESHVQFDVAKYAGFFSDIQQYADAMSPASAGGKQLASSESVSGAIRKK